MLTWPLTPPPPLSVQVLPFVGLLAVFLAVAFRPWARGGPAVRPWSAGTWGLFAVVAYAMARMVATVLGPWPSPGG